MSMHESSLPTRLRLLLSESGLEGNHLVLVGGAGAVFLLVLLVVYLLRKALGPAKQHKTLRHTLPAFDVEGGSPGPPGSLPTAVIEAVASADVRTIRHWIASGAAIDAPAVGTSETALHIAARNGHVHVLRLLIEAGADALSVDTELQTPLHFVASEGHGMCVKALLDSGGDPEAKDINQRTPLELAEGGKHMGCLRMMRLYLERRGTQGADKGAMRRNK